MGLNASSEEWCRKSDEALHGVRGIIKLVDDVLVFATTMETLIERIKEVLHKCKQNNITISKRKFRIGQRIKFAGFIRECAALHPPFAPSHL